MLFFTKKGMNGFHIVTFIYKPLQKLSSTGPRLYFTILGFYAIFSS